MKVTHISEISVIGRTGQGVRIMRTGAGEVVAVALAPYYAEPDEGEAEGLAAEENGVDAGEDMLAAEGEAGETITAESDEDDNI